MEHRVQTYFFFAAFFDAFFADFFAAGFFALAPFVGAAFVAFEAFFVVATLTALLLRAVSLESS